MRSLLLCLALSFALGGLFAAAPARAEERPPTHDCLEGGSMDYTPADRAIVTQTPVPSTGS